MIRTKFIAVIVSLAGAIALVTAWAGSGHASAPKPHQGGTITMTETATWPVGLDPATNTSDLGDTPYMQAIYGNLFDQGNGDAILPDLATGYTLSANAMTLTIDLRQGVVFSDGTPFNAQAVAYNISRDLDPKYACICDSSFPVASITTPNNYTVVMHLSKPFSPIVDEFFDAAPNWIASPTALAKKGEVSFSQYPVGAGPFEVVSDVSNSELVVKRNPSYWQRGHPYLDGITFRIAGNDTSAYEALLAGNAQVAENLLTPSLQVAAKKHGGLHINPLPGRAQVGGIQLNMSRPPFNNQLAREAVYYATDPGPINKALAFGTGILSQSPSLPGSPFYEPKVPGYRSYNLAKAKALVKQLGGLSFNLIYSGSTGEDAALQAQWQRAGMHVTLTNDASLQPIIAAYKTRQWQAMLMGAGGINPAISVGSSYWRYYSTGPFTGTFDPQLDQLVDKASATASTAGQVAIYKQIYSYLAQKAYLPFLYAALPFNVSAKNVHGPGISTRFIYPRIQDVWVS